MSEQPDSNNSTENPDYNEKTCSIDGCDKKHVAKGLCRSHYAKARTDRLTETGPIESVSEDTVKDSSPKTCKFIVSTPYEVNVQVERRDGPISEKRLVYRKEQCSNNPNGENGFCKNHSYPVLKPISKAIDIIEKQLIEISGQIKEVEIPKTVTTIWNIGEHVPTEYFSQSEIDHYVKEGFVGIRCSLDKVITKPKIIELSDGEIKTLLSSKTGEELAAIINVMNYSEDTLIKISANIASPVVEVAIKAKLA